MRTPKLDAMKVVNCLMIQKKNNLIKKLGATTMEWKYLNTDETVQFGEEFHPSLESNLVIKH